MSQDPHSSERPFRADGPGPYDESLRSDPAGYAPYQPYRPGSYPMPYEPSYQQSYRMEGEKAAQLSLIFGLVGFFVAGLVFGPLAIWQARKAERLGVPATAGKVLGWIITALYAALVLVVVIALVFFVVALAISPSYSS